MVAVAHIYIGSTIHTTNNFNFGSFFENQYNIKTAQDYCLLLLLCLYCEVEFALAALGQETGF